MILTRIPETGMKGGILSPILQTKTLSERLGNMPKVTQLNIGKTDTHSPEDLLVIPLNTREEQPPLFGLLS